jgi:hypothetical protein
MHQSVLNDEDELIDAVCSKESEATQNGDPGLTPRLWFAPSNGTPG